MENDCRLIDANDVWQKTFICDEVAEVRKFIEQAPTVDAVEVVRCKDCKHYKPQYQGVHRNCKTPYCMRCAAVKVLPDDFCSYGERREGE